MSTTSVNDFFEIIDLIRLFINVVFNLCKFVNLLTWLLYFTY